VEGKLLLEGYLFQRYNLKAIHNQHLTAFFKYQNTVWQYGCHRSVVGQWQKSMLVGWLLLPAELSFWFGYFPRVLSGGIEYFVPKSYCY
jgi:hypothetical protein